jgi:HEAT repeat protein
MSTDRRVDSEPLLGGRGYDDPNRGRPPEAGVSGFEPELPNAKVAGLLALLRRSDNPAVRAKAAELLGELGPSAMEAVPALTAALDGDPDARVRRWAAISLILLGTNAEAALTLVLVHLGNGEFEVRRSLVRALARIGEPLVGRLTSLLGSPFASARTAAVAALTEIGRPAARAVPAMVAAAERGDDEFRALVAFALGEMGPLGTVGPLAECAPAFLLAAARSRVRSLRDAAAWSLHRLGLRPADPSQFR